MAEASEVAIDQMNQSAPVAAVEEGAVVIGEVGRVQPQLDRFLREAPHQVHIGEIVDLNGRADSQQLQGIRVE